MNFNSFTLPGAIKLENELDNRIMTLSHWAAKTIEEKHEALMRWVTTTLEETDSQVAIDRLVESDVVPQLVANFFMFNLKGSLPTQDVENLKISLGTISRSLRLAFEQSYAYLLTPEAFLADFLASIEGVTLDESFFNKLDLLVEHDYVPGLLGAWAKSKLDNGIGFITRTDLVVKLHEIDTMLLRNATISVLVDLLDPIYNFHRHQSPDPGIPGSELAAFFEDKDVPAAVEAFEAKEDDLFTLKEAIDVISGMIGTGISKVDEPETTTAEEIEYPVTDYNELLQDLHEAGVDIRSPHAIFRPLPPLEMFVSPKLRVKTINKVFHGKREGYKRLIKLINNSAELSTAMLNLETTLQLQQIDLDSKVAQKLRNAISKRFNEAAA